MKSIRHSYLIYLSLLILYFYIATPVAAIILQPWTEAETSLFHIDTYDGYAGSGWVGNTLTLNYPITSSYSTTGSLSIGTTDYIHFIPDDVVGIRFGVTQTTQTGRVYFTVRSSEYATGDYGFHFDQQVRTPYDNTDFYGIVGGGINVLYDIYEEHINSSIYVNFIFIEDLVSTQAYTGCSIKAISFDAPGTTIFSDVSWIIADGEIQPLPSPFASNDVNNPVPEPSTLLLLGSGLAGLVGWRHRWRRSPSDILSNSNNRAKCRKRSASE